MLIADGGGGYGGTHWMSKEVPAMWAAIANQQTEPHFEVVAGWRKTADLTLAHLAQVQVYRDNLASVWPPSKSPAAAAYIARLDKLMVDLQATHDAASANYTAFSTVTLTLSLARQKLEALYQKYESNAKQNFVWQQKKEAAAASPTPTPSPSPSGARDVPPVSSAQQEELNRQARVIMYDLSSTILSGQTALQKPKPYDPNPISRENPQGERSGTDSGSGFAVPPIIPPPGASSGGGASGFAHNTSLNSTVTPIQPTTITPVHSGPVSGGSGTGPVLGGTGPTPVITPPTTGLPPTPAPSPGPVPPPTPPGLFPGIIAPPGGGPVPPGGFLPTGAKPPPSGLPKPGPGTGPGGRMTMPSGGVIGATPGSGMIGQMPAGSPGSRPASSVRPNPIGGVIGQQGGGSAGLGGGPAGRGPGNQSMPLGHQAGRGRNQRDGGAESAHWDPDNPWATDEGVDPVVLPPGDQGPIDPGPAIGYRR